MPTRIETQTKRTSFQANIDRNSTPSLTPPEVFKLCTTAVWTVIAASSATNLQAMSDVSVASAVAISENKLLTNYHVVEGRPFIIIKHGERFENAHIISEDKQADICIIKVEHGTLKPVRGFRKYATLTIGENVYSVGSPKGLENTLGVGVVSGKRALSGTKLIQTTAQISSGSSGGLI